MKKMKVVLLGIYTEDMNNLLEEIGICSIAAYLREHGYEVLLIGTAEKKVDYNQIVEFNPDIIGFTVYNMSKEAVGRVYKKILKQLPNVYLGIGGCLPSYYDIEIMEEMPEVHFAIRGEGEQVWLELVEALNTGSNLKNIRGLTYRDHNEIVINEKQEYIKDLNTLPFPSRDILVNNNLKQAIISTSRGCTSNCSFCVSRKFWGKWRGRTAKNIVDEVEMLVKNYSIASFDFIDSSFEDPGSDYDRISEIATEIVKRNLRISYYVNMRSEFHRKATPELMELLKKSGLCGVFFGIESANNNDQRLYRKRATIEDNFKAIQLFRDYEIGVNIGFINFNPYSTFEGLYDNIEFLEKNGFAGCFDNIQNTYRLYKGTHLYNKLETDGLLIDGKYDDFYRYKYQDERVAQLAQFLNSWLKQFNEACNRANEKLYYYNYMFQINVAHYKRYFNIDEHKDAYALVCEYEIELKKVLTKINTLNATWFKELLTLAENNWDENTANNVMNKYITKDFISSIVSQLNIQRYKLYEKLLKINRSYSTLL